MSAGSQIDWGSNVPLYDPSGQLRAIPQDQAHAALAQPGVKRAIPMIDPQGTHHWVSEDQVQPAVAAGGRISFPSQQIPPWLGFTPSNVASNIWQGAKGAVVGTGALLKDLISNPNWFEGSNSTYQKFIGAPAEQQVVQAGQALNAGHPVEAGGHALASALPFVGPAAASVAQQVGRGDIGGGIGQGVGMVAGMKALDPSSYNSVVPSRGRATANMGAVKGAIGDGGLEHAQSYNLANDLIDKWTKNGEPVPSQLTAYVQNADLADASHARAQANPDFAAQLAQRGITPQPYSFEDLWQAREALNSLKFDRNILPKTSSQIGKVADLMTDELQAAADARGFGPQWKRAQGEYSAASSLIRAADNIGPLVGAGVGAYYGRGLGALADSGLMAAGAVGGKILGKPVIGGLVRSVMDRSAPASNYIGPRSGVTDTLTPANLGATVGGFVNRIKSSPKFSTPPPLPRPTPPSPEAYTRILLDAKEGKITPGYADTLIKRRGGSTRTTPLPTPPGSQ